MIEFLSVCPVTGTGRGHLAMVLDMREPGSTASSGVNFRRK
ncbi:MAG TPA: hypothetical protein VNG51_21000 [Ktedonobacteraceae bacterium]|nr:hypothetical protein [Ktedonobacteraceae bacterium]